MTFRLVALVGLTLACGIPSPAPEPLVAEDLTHQKGCDDVIIAAFSTQDTVGVHFFSRGLIQGLGDSPRTVTFPLPDPRVKLERWEGTGLSTTVCRDVAEGALQRTHEALSGTAVLVLRPAAPGAYPRKPTADLRLSDVVFEVAGTRQTLPALEIRDVLVGWYPG